MRVLVVGASGQLGHALVGTFGAKHEVIGSGYRHAAPGQLVIDLGDPPSLVSALDAANPDLILIAGAQTHVDRCETETAECERINVEGPREVARWAGARGAVVVYYSTDHVFAGGEQRFTESDPIAPMNAYARSKAAGEAAVRTALPGSHLVLRTSWLYGPDPARRNFALRLVDRLRQGESANIPSDQWGCPTYTEDLAVATLALLECGATGTFHACGAEIIDRVGLACRICHRFAVPASGVIPTPTAALGQAAPRPLRVAMDCGKLTRTIDVRFRDLEAGLSSLAASEHAR
jgi:dTDP-4-dehydrorhamnose reductase